MPPTPTWARAAAVAGPLAVIAAYASRPFVRDYLDSAVLARSITEHTGRWVVSSLLLPMGYAAIALAFHGFASRSVAGPLMALASALLGVQAGAVVGAGSGGADAGDARAAVEAIRGWEGPLIGAVLVLAALAWLGFARHAGRSLPTRGWRAFVGVASAVAIGGLLIPSSVGEYLSAAGIAGALWATIAVNRAGEPSAAVA